jgi:hypothetical protein
METLAMKNSAYAFWLLLVVPTAPVGQHFALNGEQLGEDKSEFLRTHPTASCAASSLFQGNGSRDEVCIAREGITFDGYAATFDAGCGADPAEVREGRNCYCGLFGIFRREKLIKLMYTVDPRGDADLAVKNIAGVLAEKYGKSGPSFRWSNDSESLIVWISELPVGTKKVQLVTVALSRK